MVWALPGLCHVRVGCVGRACEVVSDNQTRGIWSESASRVARFARSRENVCTRTKTIYRGDSLYRLSSRCISQLALCAVYSRI